MYSYGDIDLIPGRKSVVALLRIAIPLEDLMRKAAD